MWWRLRLSTNTASPGEEVTLYLDVQLKLHWKGEGDPGPYYGDDPGTIYINTGGLLTQSLTQSISWGDICNLQYGETYTDIEGEKTFSIPFVVPQGATEKEYQFQAVGEELNPTAPVYLTVTGGGVTPSDGDISGPLVLIGGAVTGLGVIGLIGAGAAGYGPLASTMAKILGKVPPKPETKLAETVSKLGEPESPSDKPPSLLDTGDTDKLDVFTDEKIKELSKAEGSEPIEPSDIGQPESLVTPKTTYDYDEVADAMENSAEKIKNTAEKTVEKLKTIQENLPKAKKFISEETYKKIEKYLEKAKKAAKLVKEISEQFGNWVKPIKRGFEAVDTYYVDAYEAALNREYELGYRVDLPTLQRQETVKKVVEQLGNTSKETVKTGTEYIKKINPELGKRIEEGSKEVIDESVKFVSDGISRVQDSAAPRTKTWGRTYSDKYMDDLGL